MENIIRFSVSLPKQLLDELDSKINTQGYASRSEFTRDLIREKIVNDSWKDAEEELIGVLTLVYLHHQNDLVVKMIDIEHKANLNIVCTTHIDRKSTRLNSSHRCISYAVFCLKKKKLF